MTVSVIGGILLTGVGADAQKVTVKDGDTLSSIAQTHNVSLISFEKKNNLNDKSVVMIGQKLVLPIQPISNAINHQNKKQHHVIKNVKKNHYRANVAKPTVKAENNDQNNSQANNNQTINNDQNNDNNSSNDNLSGSQSAAKAWIADHESSDSYSAQNGQYVGKYQLDASYLHGDDSPANQEKTADQYVAAKYGSWTNAQQHWQQYNWY